MPKAVFWIVILVLVIIVLAIQRSPEPAISKAATDSAPKASGFISTGDRAVTVKGFAACASEGSLELIQRLQVQNDQVAAQRFVSDPANGCIVFAGGDTVIKSGASMFRIRVRIPGEPQELHTVSEAIRPLR